VKAILRAKSDPALARQMYRSQAEINDPTVLDWLIDEYIHRRIPIEPYPNQASIAAELSERFPHTAIGVDAAIDSSLIRELTEK
jgi:hypothetical protein